MGCFESLIKSNFFANALSELQLARTTLKTHDTNVADAYYPACKKIRKRAYDICLFDCYLMEEMLGTYTQQNDTPDMLYYVRIDSLSFVYSRVKNQISDAIRYNYNMNGEIPLYTGRHKINGYTIHTAMFDGGITFLPFSTN